MNQTFVRRARMAVSVLRLLRYQSQPCLCLPITVAPCADHSRANDSETARWLGNTPLGGRSRHALFIPPGYHVTYRFVAPPGSRFVAWCGVATAESAQASAIEFVATVHGDRPSPHLSATVRITPDQAPQDRSWRKLVLDIKNREEQRIVVTLAIHMESNGRGAAATAFWGEPFLEWPRPTGEVRGAFRRAGHLARRGRFIAAARMLHAHLSEGSCRSLYQAWLREHSLTPAMIAELRGRSSSFPYRPLVSVVTPVYNTDARWLRACIESVKSQAYANWELCLVDDGSTRAETRALLDEYEGDPRIKIKMLPTNGGIAAASNEALTLAGGEFVAFLDHDDELTPDALFEVVAFLNDHRDADFIYSDEDKLELDGTRTEAYFKPDWSPQHFLTNMYTSHLMVVRRTLVERIGGFRRGYEGAQDYDLVLRLIEWTSRIHHLPKVLYHWRRISESAAGYEGGKPQAQDAGRLALQDYVRRNNLDAEILPGALRHLYRVRYQIKGEPLISIVLPVLPDIVSSDVRAACERTLKMLAKHTNYRRLEVVLPSEKGRRAALALHVPGGLTVREVPIEATSIGGRLRQQKQAAPHARGEHLLFLDWALESSDGDWLSALLEFSQQAAIGAVGAKLHYPDGSLEHIGIVLGVNGVAAPAFHRHPRWASGYWGTAIAVRNYSAVSGNCLMTRRHVYREIGGFDDAMGEFADIDYCLRVIDAGYRVVFTPHAALVHDRPASSSRDAAVDADQLRMRWSNRLAQDPYYNPNFSRNAPDYGLDLTASAPHKS
jgi:glycosyltransferase involved in cell wall biosynthesis